MQRFVRWLVRLIVDLVAVVEIQGYDNIPARGGFVVATNHLGFLDAPMAYYGLPQLELFIPVAEKWRDIPILRWISGPLNLIFIDRFNPDLKAMREILRRMDKGQTLVIAPEGTRSRNEGLAEGKPGVSFLAARYNLPILPVAKIRVIAHGEQNLQVLPLLEAWLPEIAAAPEALLLTRLATLFPSLVNGGSNGAVSVANGRRMLRVPLAVQVVE